MSPLIKILFSVRAALTRIAYPLAGYWVVTKSVKPLSTKLGFDRGTPIDRYYIDKFLRLNSKYIQGSCLEVGDNRYTRKYGRKVTHSDVLDKDKQNKQATIYGDLNHLPIADNTYDCIVLTQVLGMIDEYDLALAELKRILKPGGVLLFTGSYFIRTHDTTPSFWRFTVNGACHVFGKFFPKASLYVSSYGNVLVGQYFWVGAATEELSSTELDYNDPHYPCLVVVRAKK